MLPNELSERDFPPINTANESPKILQQFLSNRVHKLISENDALRSKIYSLEGRMIEINDEARLLSNEIVQMQKQETISDPNLSALLECKLYSTTKSDIFSVRSNATETTRTRSRSY
jgi:hypothetical protein